MGFISQCGAGTLGIFTILGASFACLEVISRASSQEILSGGSNCFSRVNYRLSFTGKFYNSISPGFLMIKHTWIFDVMFEWFLLIHLRLQALQRASHSWAFQLLSVPLSWRASQLGWGCTQISMDDGCINTVNILTYLDVWNSDMAILHGFKVKAFLYWFSTNGKRVTRRTEWPPPVKSASHPGRDFKLAHLVNRTNMLFFSQIVFYMYLCIPRGNLENQGYFSLLMFVSEWNCKSSCKLHLTFSMLAWRHRRV